MGVMREEFFESLLIHADELLTGVWILDEECVTHSDGRIKGFTWEH